MAFQRDFNELLNEVLKAYRNQFGGDVDQGSVLFIKAACTASMLWGLYQSIAKAADQIFVGSADRAHIERHAAEYGIPTAGRSDAEIVDDVLAAKRSKMSGGNKYDYVAWAKEVTHGDESIVYAAVVPLAQGEGTFDIVVLGSKDNGTASTEICADIFDYIQQRRPIGSGFSWGIRVCGSVRDYITLTIRGGGATWDQDATKAAIYEYINGLLPSENVSVSYILYIMYQYGAENPAVVSNIPQIPPPSASGWYWHWRMESKDSVVIASEGVS